MNKTVYAADKLSDCHYCYFWTNGRKGCRLGRNNCYYLISLPPKPKSECDGCPYGRDHSCIGWCTKGGKQFITAVTKNGTYSRGKAEIHEYASGDSYPDCACLGQPSGYLYIVSAFKK